MSGTSIIVRESAMSFDMLQDAVDCASHALHVLHLREFTALAQYIKKEFDVKYGQRWHCIVGHSFGSLVGHDLSYYAYMEADSNIYFMLWRVDTEQEETEVQVNTQETSC